MAMTEETRARRRATFQRYYREVICADPERKARFRQQQKESGARHPEKVRARRLLQAAVRKGELTRPERCEDCGEVKPVQGAHRDYSKPLEVRWLCILCHGRYDRGKRERR